MSYEWFGGPTFYTYADADGIMAAQVEFDGNRWTAYDLTHPASATSPGAMTIGHYGLLAEAQAAVEKALKPIQSSKVAAA
jgi:hypothetical protein